MDRSRRPAVLTMDDRSRRPRSSQALLPNWLDNVDCRMTDAALVSLCEDLDENAIASAIEWWHHLPMHNRHELAELTIAFQPWAIKLLPIGSVETTEGDLANDLYEFYVNHEINGNLPFFGRTGRNGEWGYYTGLVLAIPLLDPDWPPYDNSLTAKSWKPDGKLRNADLGLDSPF